MIGNNSISSDLGLLHRLYAKKLIEHAIRSLLDRANQRVFHEVKESGRCGGFVIEDNAVFRICWIVHSVRQDIGANCGLQESNQIARVHLNWSISIGDR